MTHVTCLVHKGKEYTFHKYLASWGQELAPRVAVRHYRGLRATGRTLLKRLSQTFRAWRIGMIDVPGEATGEPRVYIFTDVERLDAAETERALALWQSLEAHPDTALILNHPRRSMRRFEVLTTLREHGLNSFGVYRVTELPDSPRFPVFVRDENEHGTGFSGLLHNREELSSHLLTLGDKDDKVVVEFCDAADGSGIVRKYGAFCVRDRIVARQIHFSRDWIVREPDIRTPETAREELEYVETNPHTEQLREIFALARIDYGRIDYSVVDGRIQVWEINTNPMILIPRDRQDPLRFAAHDCFGRAFNEALGSLLARN